ncbi:hypothetical protein E3Q18_04175 [Wallemia mellicola]|uniref:Rho termination factor N-terminal domain-containing protein n=1 Tax=Wallemia mellicola TaxID=1708541 RepID=A0A4T0SD04_9BASI|nr:hypothetical protein E3Q19_04088 [Wallemia mellicola]TIB94862.1 hypothetical protein E3Q18_04175 [Wallemia mellicola]TIC49612.1 hypothetical protein E3Q05_03737 [Wallemia mellicola]TIC63162.1 hypothetical protein E3Q01_03519 [Wallemia mellicola]
MPSTLVLTDIKQKRKAELVEFAQKLGVETEQLNRIDLIDNIKKHMQKNEDKLKDDAEYAQYFGDRKKSRKSVAVNDEVEDDGESLDSSATGRATTPAIQQFREKSVDVIHTSPKRVADFIEDGAANAVHEIESEANQLVEKLSQNAIKLRNCTKDTVNKMQNWLSDSQHLLLVGLLIEFLVVLYSITPIRIHRIDIPEQVQKYTTDSINLKLPYAKSLLSPPFVNPLKKYLIYSLIVPFIPSVFINFDKRGFSPLTFTLVRLSLIVIFNSQSSIESYFPLKIELALVSLLASFSLVELLSKSRK